MKTKAKKIYAEKCYPVEEAVYTNSIQSAGLLMQIPRCYTITSKFGLCRVSGFKSLIRINGKWHIDSPYFCYAGKHRYKAVSVLLSLKLDSIALFGAIKDYVTKKKEIFGMCFLKTTRKINNTINYLRHYKTNRAGKKFLNDLRHYKGLGG